MPLKPAEWNVVVAGRWNPGLFTPHAISKRIFELPEATPLEVFVSLDDVVPPKVKHKEITVSPTFSHIMLSPDRCTFAAVEAARVYARKLLVQLPHTPLHAAGVNFRYTSETAPDKLSSLFSSELDQRIADAGRNIIGRQFQRTLKHDEGHVLVRVTFDTDGSAEVFYNFELRSGDQKNLLTWLEKPIGEFGKTVELTFRNILILSEDDYVIESNDQPAK